MQIGDSVLVRAYKSDGTCYRRWVATVEAIDTDRVVLVTPVGHRVQDISGTLVAEYAIRGYYWPDRWYSLLEVYAPGGELVEIYVNISSPAQIEDSLIEFTDYELDVSRELPHEARIVDQDEFLEAVSEYAYSAEFQRACYRVAQEANGLANHWVAKGMPRVDA
jgi:protein associated with RNAse G/E